MKALVGAFNQEKALVGAFSVIAKTGCGTDGALHSTSGNTWPGANQENITTHMHIMHKLESCWRAKLGLLSVIRSPSVESSFLPNKTEKYLDATHDP